MVIPDVGGSDDVRPIRLVEFGHRHLVVREHRLEGLGGFPFLMLGSQRFHSVQREYGLCVQRMLHPQRAILVEGGNPVFRGNVIRTGLVAGSLNELNNRLLGWSVIP